MFSAIHAPRPTRLSRHIATLILTFTILAGSQLSFAQSGQRYFDNSDTAVQTLLKALEENDTPTLLDIIGKEHEQLINSGDEQADKQARNTFLEAARELLKLEEQGENGLVLVVGNEEWPFPIPLVKEASGWRFDTEAGADEILNRRIGRNELEAIAMLQALHDAQIEYSSEDRDDDLVLEYAQRLASSEGKQDGLYWPDGTTGENLSPVGPYLQAAADYLEGKSKGDPWYGYYFKILTGQGENVPGGAYDYIINDNMIAGFAIIAAPADYGNSGIVTLMVNHQNVIFAKDLGEDTLETAKGITIYNPDSSWEKVDDLED